MVCFHNSCLGLSIVFPETRILMTRYSQISYPSQVFRCRTRPPDKIRCFQCLYRKNFRSFPSMTSQAFRTPTRLPDKNSGIRNLCFQDQRYWNCFRCLMFRWIRQVLQWILYSSIRWSFPLTGKLPWCCRFHFLWRWKPGKCGCHHFRPSPRSSRSLFRFRG